MGMFIGTLGESSSQHSRKTDNVVPSWLVWSVLDRKADGLAGMLGISHKGQDAFSYKYMIQQVHIKYEMLALHIL